MGSLPQSDLVELMRAARLIIANGGSTLLQAIACGNACVAVAIAKDQAQRIRRCVEAGVALAATLDAAAMAQSANWLLQHDDERAALAGRAAALGLADGVEVALQALAGLLPPAQRAQVT
jgi:spore coat polysaccharide biosynthesis predicted glycosyltransferase SpsG